jgi:hypothetical protein
MVDFSTLIPEMSRWNNGRGIDIDAWTACSGTFDLAVGYSTVFWPSFVEFEQYVLRDGFSVESLRGFERCCSGDRKAIEAVMNHLHIVDLHHHMMEGVGRATIVYLGHTLREIYRAKLAWQFPQRRFEVLFDDSNFDDLTDYQITFFQSSEAA